jgi:hypothetical protein
MAESGNCFMDGMPMDCDWAYALAGLAADQCPANDCSVFQTGYIDEEGHIGGIVNGPNGPVAILDGEEISWAAYANWLADPANNAPPCSATKSAFINANSGAAGQIASQLNVPTANILGLAAEETGWGTSSIALSAHNFFGIHAGAPGSIGTYTTTGGARVSMFPASTGFLSSGQSFATNFGSLVNGVSNPTAFAQALVPKFNTANAATGGNPNFVRLVSGTIKGVSACGD